MLISLEKDRRYLRRIGAQPRKMPFAVPPAAQTSSRRFRYPWGMRTVSKTFSQSTDKRLLAFYEAVRLQVDADIRAGGRYRFEHSVRQFADSVQDELKRRKIKFAPIDWRS